MLGPTERWNQGEFVFFLMYEHLDQLEVFGGNLRHSASENRVRDMACHCRSASIFTVASHIGRGTWRHHAMSLHALQSQMCDNMSCGIKIHIPCVAKYFKGRSDPQCPVCNAFWPHEIPGKHAVPLPRALIQCTLFRHTEMIRSRVTAKGSCMNLVPI